MKFQDFPQDAKDAIQRIHQSIEAEIDHLGPHSELGRMRCAEEDVDDVIPEQLILGEWVLLTSWMDLNEGDYWRTYQASKNLPRHHADGLMRTFIS